MLGDPIAFSGKCLQKIIVDQGIFCIRKVYKTKPLICSNASQNAFISFIDQPDVIKKSCNAYGYEENLTLLLKASLSERNKRAYPRPILQPQPETDPPQAEANQIPS